ncbi:WXG100 family type VII secretion target [Streptomyces sp. NPDC048650]|uniref:WXG100 family type VII secretion target n=1 Tax=unclassified Streptomyces TaxID=2593676 RepID=UPI00371770B5
MTFQVEPDDLQSFAKQLERASGDATKALEYMKRECSIGTFDKGPVSALASMWGSGHDSVVDYVSSTLEKMHRILEASQREMARSAKFYEATDQGEASKMDSTYPGSKR